MGSGRVALKQRPYGLSKLAGLYTGREGASTAFESEP